MTPAPVSPVDPLQAILDDTTNLLAGLFEQMDWAEEEIRRTARRHRRHTDMLFHCFLLLTPTDALMGTEFVYRSHCRELLRRVLSGEDTRPGTAAEVCCALSAASTVAPFTSPASGLYFRMWAQAFPEQPNFGADRLEHHEALEASVIDDLETTLRGKLAVPTRQLGTPECGGRHHGTPVACRYHTPSSNIVAAPAA